jgi:cytidylate kinase
VIIIGRGGNVVTAALPQVLHVRLVGSEARRVVRLQEEFKQSRESALTFLRKADEGRRRYVRRYYHAEIDDPLRYHLIVNTDLLLPDAVGRLIANSLLSA